MGNSEFYDSKVATLIFAYISAGPKAGMQLIAHSLPLQEQEKKLLYKLIQLPRNYDEFLSQENQVIWRYIPFPENADYSLILEHLYSGFDDHNRHTYNTAVVCIPRLLDRYAYADRLAALFSKVVDNIALKIEEFENEAIPIQIERTQFFSSDVGNRNIPPVGINYILMCENSLSCEEKRFAFIKFICENQMYQKSEVVFANNIIVQKLQNSLRNFKISNVDLQLDKNEWESYMEIKRLISLIKRTPKISTRQHENNAYMIKVIEELCDKFLAILTKLWCLYEEYKRQEIGFNKLKGSIPEITLKNIDFFFLSSFLFHRQKIKNLSEKEASAFNALFHEFIGIIITESNIKPVNEFFEN